MADGGVQSAPSWRAVLHVLRATPIEATQWAAQWDDNVNWLQEQVKRVGGGSDGELAVSVNGLPVCVSASREAIRDLYGPLLALCNLLAMRAAPARVLIGIVAPAGAGKSTLTMVLRELQRLLALRTASGDASRDPAIPGLAVLSMDAYHRYNADLDAAGLRRFKGRIDTIDAAAFAADLHRLRTCIDADVALPEYDRAVTHDPVAGAMIVTPRDRIVLVEGLYLCASLSPGDVTVDTHAWTRVLDACDVVLHLCVSKQLSKQRTVDRKVASGRDRGEAEAYYDRVDAPIFEQVARSVAAPRLRSDRNALALWLGVTAPDDRRIRIASAVGGAQSAPECRPTPVMASGGSATHRIAVIGLNPCIQRTLVFASRSDIDGLAWRRGEVNRATDALVSVGGKGQHCALALLRSRVLSASDNVHLYQFVGGESGARVLQHLQHQRTLAGTGTPELHLHSVDTGPGTTTRTCVTLLDAVASDMTELIEPSATVAAAQADELVRQIADTALDADAIAIMGTAPPGAADVFGRVADAIAGLPSGRRRPHVLLDGYKGVSSLLASGAVTLLKVNASELRELRSTACSMSPVCSAAAALSGVVDDMCAVLRAFPSLQAVATTAGPDAAWLARRGVPPAVDVAVTQFHIPADMCKVANPIGAGDTVAGVMLAHVVASTPLEDAMALGLAAGSASVLTFTGAEWRHEDAQRILSCMRTRSFIEVE